MSESDKISQNSNDAAPERDSRVKWTRLFYVIFILGIIGAGMEDIPRNITEFTQIGFSSSLVFILVLLLSLFRIFKYLAFPIFLYYLLVDLFARAVDEGQLLLYVRKFLSYLKK